MKKRLSTLTAWLLLFAILFSCAGTAFADSAKAETEFPTVWNLGDLFESDEDWYAAYDRADSQADTLEQYRGTLGTAEGMLQYTRACLDGEFDDLISRLSVYADLKSSLDGTDPTARQMTAKITALQEKQQSLTAYVTPELYELTLEERTALFADPLLESYAYYFRDYTDEKTVHYSEETNIALAKASTVYGQAYTAFETLAFSEQPYPEILLPDGTSRTANKSLYNEIVFGDCDQDTKLQVAKAYYSAPAAFANTYATLLNASALEYLASAKLAGYDNVLEYVLHSNDVEREVYDNIKETVRALLPVFQQYLAETKESCGLEHMYYHNTVTSFTDYYPDFTYDEACGIMLEALSLMGDDYLNEVQTVLESGHVDVYPSSTKNTGGFEESCNQDSVYPYILLNFTDDFDSVSTLCHEMGHAMYARFSEKNPLLNNCSSYPTIFTHEVASTTNEFLVSFYMLDQAQSDEERLFYLENLVTLISTTVIRQIMYSEFEEYIYATVESGSSLTSDGLCSKWMELSREYYGEAVEFPEGYEYRWSQVPHFYYGYYVYKYATSATYAAAISQKLYNDESGALEAYKQFLELGCSASPSALLKTAGADTLDSKTYQYLIDLFSSLVDQIGNLR